MSLNDPQWGRGNSQNDKDDRDSRESDRQDENNTNTPDDRRNEADRRDDSRKGSGDDLDRLWDEFNKALGGMLGGSRQRSEHRGAQQNQWHARKFAQPVRQRQCLRCAPRRKEHNLYAHRYLYDGLHLSAERRF